MDCMEKEFEEDVYKRQEKDTDKLERLYEEGFMLGEAFCEKCVEKE